MLWGGILFAPSTVYLKIYFTVNLLWWKRKQAAMVKSPASNFVWDLQGEFELNLVRFGRNFREGSRVSCASRTGASVELVVHWSPTVGVVVGVLSLILQIPDLAYIKYNIKAHLNQVGF